MNTAPKQILSTLAATALTFGTTSAAVTVGQIDDFQDGTLQNWSNSLVMAGAPTNQPNSGPTGAGDNALFSIVGGNPDTFGISNSTQWAGDYTTAGITTIQFDANNLGVSAIDIGIILNGGAAATNTVFVPVGTGWNTYSIDLTTLSSGSPATLGAVTSLELVSYNSGSGTVVSVGALDLFVDNITATPEPSTSLLTLLALAGLFTRRNR